MKTLKCCFLLAALFIPNLSCTSNDVLKKDEQAIILKKEDVLPLIENKTWGLTKIERQVGTGSKAELPESPEYTAYRTKCSFTYVSGFVGFYSGTESTSAINNSNYQFPASAKTFSIFTRITLPVGLDYYWDETAGTLVTHCFDGTKILKIPAEQLAYLEKSSVVLYKTMEEAKAASVPENITLVSTEKDASLGTVTYYYSFRPLYQYTTHDTQWENDDFVMF